MSAFDEVVLPGSYGYGSGGSSMFSTDVNMLANRREQRNQNWAGEFRKFNLVYPVKDVPKIIALRNFFRLRNGKARGFKILDPLDFSSNPSDSSSLTIAQNDQLIGTGDGVTTDFQLKTTITDGLNSFDYLVYKPQSGVLIADNGTLRTLTTHYTINALGMVHFLTAPVAAHSITAGFKYWVPVRFDTDDYMIVYDTYRGFQVVACPLMEIIPDA